VRPGSEQVLIGHLIFRKIDQLDFCKRTRRRLSQAHVIPKSSPQHGVKQCIVIGYKRLHRGLTHWVEQESSTRLVIEICEDIRQTLSPYRLHGDVVRILPVNAQRE
jgi:hypothetical protein